MKRCWYCGEPIDGEPWEIPNSNGIYCCLCALMLCGPYEAPTEPVPPKEA